MTTRSTILAAMESHAPHLLPRADQLLSTFSGREDQLLAMVQKGGANLGSPTPGSTGGGDHRARLVRYYTKWAPEKLNKVDAALKAYAGDEETLFQDLVAKYGPEPPAPPVGSSSTGALQPAASAGASSGGDVRARLTAYFLHYDPKKVKTIEKLLKAYNGDDDDMWRDLTEKYGPVSAIDAAGVPPSSAASPTQTKVAPPPAAAAAQPQQQPPPTTPQSQNAAVSQGTSNNTAATARDRVVNIFRKYAPGKLKNVDKVINAYAGDDATMFADLTAKYGPEPPLEVEIAAASPPPVAASPQPPSRGGPVGATSSSPAAISSAAATSTDAAAFRARILAMYQCYAPDKVGSVDKAIAAYEGDRDGLVADLVAKYGPEPGGAASGSPQNNALQRARVAAMYQKYAPEKVGSVDKAIEAYEGDYASLLQDLVVKYGRQEGWCHRRQDQPAKSQPAGPPLPRRSLREEEGEEEDRCRRGQTTGRDWLRFIQNGRPRSSERSMPRSKPTPEMRSPCSRTWWQNMAPSPCHQPPPPEPPRLHL